MRLAKGFFLPFLAAEWLHYRCRPPCLFGDVNCNSPSTINNNFRMRLAKGFFLPFLAAEWLQYRRRPPTGGQPAANRRPTAGSSQSLLVM